MFLRVRSQILTIEMNLSAGRPALTQKGGMQRDEWGGLSHILLSQDLRALANQQGCSFIGKSVFYDIHVCI